MKKLVVPWLFLGLIASLVIMVGNTEPRATAQDPPKVAWTAKDFQDAGSLICAWEKGKAEEVAKVCEELGFEIVEATAMRIGVVCKWKGDLDPKKLEALRSHELVRYVEPNLTYYATPFVSAVDVNQTVEFKPVFTPDNVLPELKKAGSMICAWRPGTDKFKVAKDCEDAGFKVTGINEKHEPKYLVCGWDGELKQETVNKLAANEAVLYIEPNYEVGTGRIEQGTGASDAATIGDAAKPFAVLPQDEFISQLYGMRNINAPLAWKSVQTSPVVVAVCDTGIDYTHEDLRDNMWQNPKGTADKFGADFIDTVFDRSTLTEKPGTDPKDRHFHGTHVAGTVGAVGNNKVGVAGVNWRVQLMAVRCLGANGSGKSNSVQKAIEYAADNGAKVINLSLGRPGGPLRSELEVIKKAREKGCILVCAAGNDGTDNGTAEHYPTNYTKFVDNIISVANTDINNKLNTGSNFNKQLVHLGAPGTDILSTMPMTRTEGFSIEEKKAADRGVKITLPTKYGRLSGTSMAAPHTAGAVALMLGHPKHSSLLTKPPADVKTTLFNGVNKLAALDGKCATGGLLDMSFLGEGASPPPIPPRTPLPPPVVICPNRPPCLIICPPPYQCPQHPRRIFGRCR